MSETAAIDHSADVYEPSLTPDSQGKLGMWLFLISDAMSFGALLAAYGAVRAGAAEWAPPIGSARHWPHGTHDLLADL